MGLFRSIPILVVFLLLILLPFILNTTSADVAINFEQDNIIYEFKENDPRKLELKGKITHTSSNSNINDDGYIEVNLLFSDQEGWTKGLGPYQLHCPKNGEKNFTLLITLPVNVRNRTTNKIVVSGSIPSGDYVADDEVEVTIIRPYYSSGSGTTSLNYDPSPGDWFDVFLPYFIIIIVVLIIIAIVGIYYHKKQEKEMIKFIKDQLKKD